MTFINLYIFFIFTNLETWFEFKLPILSIDYQEHKVNIFKERSC